jgi:hypothetical protein
MGITVDLPTSPDSITATFADDTAVITTDCGPATAVIATDYDPDTAVIARL